MISPTMAHPVISTPLAVRNFKQFEVKADFFAEHFQQIDTESRAALVQVRVDCCVTLSGKIKKYNRSSQAYSYSLMTSRFNQLLSVWWIKLTHVGFRAHVKIASRIVLPFSVRNLICAPNVV